MFRSEQAFLLSPIGLAIVAPSGKFESVNKSLCDLLEYSAEELRIKTFQEVTHPDDLDENVNRVNACIKGEIDNYSMDKRYITKSGKIVWANLTVTTVRKEDKLEFFLSQIQDITESKMFTEHTMLALNSGGIGTWTWFSKKDILIWDDMMFKIYGLEKSNQPLDYAFFERCVHPEDRKKVAEDIAACISGDKEYKVRFRIIQPNGNIRYLAGRGKIVTDSLGNFDIMNGINYDITEQVYLENEIKKKNKELENFAYLVSHDLREPLRTINGFSQLLKDRCKDKMDDKSHAFVEHIVNGSKKLESIVHNLLDQCKHKVISLERTRVDVSLCLDKVLNAILFSTHKAKIYKENLGTIYMNEVHLHQILQNFITNALKYTEVGKTPEIEIFMRDSQTESVICVRDNGIGICDGDKDKLFEMFMRAKGNTKEGNGIGLALCKKIVDMYDGEIWVESELGKGSTFCFSIPKEQFYEKE